MEQINRRDFLRRLSAGAAGCLAAGPLWRSARAWASGETGKLNFVFLLVDDLGWADLGCYGNTFHETPHIDRLARQGMRFTNAYAACPVCSPTRASILTGKYPARLHLTDWIPGRRQGPSKLLLPKWTQRLEDKEVTLAEALGPCGYVSAAIGKWHLGGGQAWPTRQGFDVNVCAGPGTPRSYFSPYRNRKLPNGPRGEYLTDRLNAEAVRFLEANKHRPFFLYLPHHAVHTPIKAKADLTERYKAKLARRPRPTGRRGRPNPAYAAMIHSVDEGVGRICAKLDELKIADRTVVILFSDNGGYVPVTSNAPLYGGKGTLFEGGIREPMIVRWPGVVAAGSTCDVPVISTDFYPTLLEIAGAGSGAPSCPDGVSLLPLLKRTGTIRREAIYWHYPHYHRTKPAGAVRRGDWKLIEYYEDGRVALFNVKDDLGEKNNLAGKRPAKAAELRKMLHDWRKAVGAQMPLPNPYYKPRKARPARGGR